MTKIAGKRFGRIFLLLFILLDSPHYVHNHEYASTGEAVRAFVYKVD